MTMTHSSPQIVRFGEFELDLRSGELSNGAARLLLPDQPFRLLAFLIRERGSLVTRDDLRRELWPEGTFVDFERSLNAAVKRLRETLGDSAASPRFIETLPRRGYRFIAAVDGNGNGTPPAPTSTVSAAVSALGTPDPIQEPHDNADVPAPQTIGRSGFPRRMIFATAAAIAFTTLVFLAAVALTRDKGGELTGPSQPRRTRLTHLGTVRLASVSPDGQHLAYVRTDDVRESLWLRRIDGENAVQLLGPVDGFFRSLTFGPDGFVYYTLLRPDLTHVPLERVPVGGGPSERILQASGGVSFSPDGSRYAYVSTTSLALQESRIVIVDMKGAATRAVAVKRPPEAFLRIKPAWSPDGTELAVVSTHGEAPQQYEILLIDPDGGRVRIGARLDRITVGGLLWADRAGFVMAATEDGALTQRLWHVSLASGEVRPLTYDVSDYSLAGIADGGRSVIAVRGNVATSVWVADLMRLEAARQIAVDSGEPSGLEGLSWASDGRLFYGTAESGNMEIWSYDSVTHARQRITFNPGEDFHPAASPDGRTIVYASSGADAGVWAMSADGSGRRRRLTTGGDSHPAFFPDGKSVAFQRMTVDTLPFTIGRVPLAGGRVTQIGANHSMRPAISPDGRLVAHYWMTPEEWRLGVTRVGEQLPMRSLTIRPSHSGRIVRWSADGSALAFIDGHGGAWNIWTQPLDGGPARKLTQFAEGRIATFDWSRDGSRLAWIRINEVRDVVMVDVGGPSSRED